jgi:hypothetical protein
MKSALLATAMLSLAMPAWSQVTLLGPPVQLIGAQAPMPPSKVKTVDFDLHVNPAFRNCLGPDPKAHVHVVRQDLNDKLTITITGIKPDLDFDLFTTQRSQLDANGNVIASFAMPPNFGSFGLAWYQSDLHAEENGNGQVTIQTILLDQIFGFDADRVNPSDANDTRVKVPPTNTFHLGFWFNDPNDAAPCGFDVNKPTPFNGEHRAGPNAMISVPVLPANLGPLCTSPTGSTQDDVDKDPTKFLCNP